MTVSVVPGNSALYSDLQSLLQQASSGTSAGASTSGTTPEFMILEVAAPVANSDNLNTSSSIGNNLGSAGAAGGTSTTGASNSQFSPSTIQTLLATQESSPTSQSIAGGPVSAPADAWQQIQGGGGWAGLAPQNMNWNLESSAIVAAGRAAPASVASAEAGASTGTTSTTLAAGGTAQSPLSLLNSLNAGATSQTTSNSNGSMSTTITYADGSAVTLTQPPPSSSVASSAASSSAGSAAGPVSSSNATTPAPALEALVAAQANALSSQALLARVEGTGAPMTSATMPEQISPMPNQSTDNNALGFAQNLLTSLTSGDTGATSQVTQNQNGTTTTTITYADGSSLALTGPPPSTASPGTTGDTSEGGGLTNGGTTVSNFNLIEQMIQLQSQLLAQTGTQTSTTA